MSKQSLFNGQHTMEQGQQEDDSFVGMENVLEQLGVPGKYQIGQILCLAMCTTPYGLVMFNMVFFGYAPAQRCHVINETELLAEHDLLDDTTAKILYSSCHISVTSNYTGHEETLASFKCYNGYSYRDSVHVSMVTEWDLFCDKKAMVPLVQIMLIAGNSLGAVFLSYAADRYGGRLIYTLAAGTVVLSEMTILFAQNVYLVLGLRFCSGFSLCGMYMLLWVMSSELVISRHRQTLGAIISIWFSLNSVLLSGSAYLFRHNWRHLELTICIGAVITFLLSFCINNTPSWYFAKGRYEDAEQILAKACWINSHNFDDMRKTYGKCVKRATLPASTDISGHVLRGNSNHSILDGLRNKELLIIMGISCFISFTFSLVYHSFYFLSATLSGNRFLNFFFMSMAEIPGCLIFMVMLLYWGRRTVLFLFVALSVCLLLASTILAVWIPKAIALTVFTLFSQFTVQASAYICIAYTPELYPTTWRATGVGINTAVKRIAGILVPFSPMLSEKHQWAPYTVALALFALAFCLIPKLPETRGRQLPSNTEETMANDKLQRNHRAFISKTLWLRRGKENSYPSRSS